MARFLEVAGQHQDFLYELHFRTLEVLALVEVKEREKQWQHVHDFIEEYRRSRKL